MTYKEASDVLDDYDVNFEGHSPEEVAMAFDCAFRALEQEPCEDCRTCNKWSECECGEKGHKNGTSIGYLIGECKDYEPCEDCISRQAVLDTIEELKKIHFDRVVVLNKVRDRVLGLPPDTPKPKTGHWIEDAKTYYEELNKRGLGVDEYTPYFTDDIACSECLAKYSMLDNETQFFKHCPNCGAKMESEG